MRLATGSVGRSENSRGHGGVKSAPSLVLPIQFFPLCHLFSVTSKLPVVSYITLLFLLLQSGMVLRCFSICNPNNKLSFKRRFIKIPVLNTLNNSSSGKLHFWFSYEYTMGQILQESEHSDWFFWLRLSALIVGKWTWPWQQNWTLNWW